MRSATGTYTVHVNFTVQYTVHVQSATVLYYTVLILRDMEYILQNNCLYLILGIFIMGQ